MPACQAEPARDCERVRFSWPFFQLDLGMDTVPTEEGLQLDFTVRSQLRPDTVASLYIGHEDDEPVFAGTAVADESGDLPFQGITIPLGKVVFFIEARDSCGRFRSGKRVYVFDGLGEPRCDLRFPVPATIDPDGSLPILGAEQDADPSQEGMQFRITVDAGRPDMKIKVFVADRERDEQQRYDVDASDDGTANLTIPLATGEQAIRAVCEWELEGLFPSSPTYAFFVEDLP